MPWLWSGRDKMVGVKVVRNALVEPLRWIAENAGEAGYVVTTRVADADAGTGFNASTGESTKIWWRME